MTEWIEKAIHFVLQHNEVMVQTMLVLVVAWGALILGSWVLSKSEEGQPSGTSASTTSVAQGESAAAIGAAVAAEAATQVAKLQLELTTRAQEVESLKAKISALPPTESVDISGYVKKIKDLEGKLSEYEILEDDIADLSLYKEENIRLKNELQRLGADVKAAPAAAPVVAAEAPVVPAVVTPNQPDAIVEQFAVAVEQNKSVAAPSAVATATADGDDLLTEFAASMSDSVSSSEGISEGGLDTEKMIAEMASLEGVQDDGTALEGEADIDKMAEEATKLLGS